METFDGNIQVNRYDAEGLRHEMEENGSLVKFIFNPDREAVVEENSSGLTRYIRSSELIARNTDAARTYYHYVSDEMGSTTHIVDEDGIILNHYTYDAWGNLTAQEEAVPNRFKFTGQQLDPVTQQYYLRARFYNPVIARFTQEDTYRGDGLNLYAYCTNNPILYADLTGHEKDLLSRHSNDSTFEERFNQNLQEELVFNKQHGLQTYYDTPQAKAQNEHITNNQPSKTISDIPTKRKNSTDYTYNMIENPGPLADMPDYPIKNFYGGKYNETILSEDTVFYRAGQEGTPLGQWFTTTPAESVAKVRIDLAVKPQWIDPITGNLTGTSIINTNYSIKIPAGTTIYYGPVGYQGGVYLGGDNIIQTFIPKPWLIDGVEVIGQTPLQ